MVLQITTEVSYVGFFEVYFKNRCYFDTVATQVQCKDTQIQLQHRYSVKIHTSELKLVQMDRARPSNRPSIVTRDNILYNLLHALSYLHTRIDFPTNVLVS